MFYGAFRRNLENKGGTPTIIFLNDEKFAGKPLPDRLLQKIYDKKGVFYIFLTIARWFGPVRFWLF